MKNIKEKFKNKHITDNNVLEYYINFCKINNLGKPEKHKVALHHILPESIYPEYKDLNINKWNGVYLTHHNHYYAHWLLTYCLNSSSMFFAFSAMHNQDVKSGRLKDNELIHKEEYDKIRKIGYELRKQNKRDKSENYILKSVFHKHLNAIISEIDLREFNGNLLKTNKNHYFGYKEFSKSVLINNGFGNRIGLYVEKTEIKPLKEYTNEEINKLIKNSSYTQEIYILKSIYNNSLNIRLTFNDVESISQGLINTSKEHYLGSKQKYKYQLLKRNKGKLIGLYIEKSKGDGFLKTKTEEELKKIIDELREYKKEQMFVLKSIYDRNIKILLSVSQINEIYPSLFKSSRQKFLGYLNNTKGILRSNEKEYLLGLYLDEKKEMGYLDINAIEKIKKLKIYDSVVYYELSSVFDTNIKLLVTKQSVNRLSRRLIKTSKDDYLGKLLDEELVLHYRDKSNLIGLYVTKRTFNYREVKNKILSAKEVSEQLKEFVTKPSDGLTGEERRIKRRKKTFDENEHIMINCMKKRRKTLTENPNILIDAKVKEIETKKKSGIMKKVAEKNKVHNLRKSKKYDLYNHKGIVIKNITGLQLRKEGLDFVLKKRESNPVRERGNNFLFIGLYLKELPYVEDYVYHNNFKDILLEAQKELKVTRYNLYKKDILLKQNMTMSECSKLYQNFKKINNINKAINNPKRPELKDHWFERVEVYVKDLAKSGGT